MREQILMLLAAAALMACGSSPERERVDFERMRRQQRTDLYGSSRVFPNEIDMQAPPSGTVARETREDTGVVGSGTVGGAAVTSVPLPLTAGQRATGAKDFRIYCAVCHGPAGYGGSTVAENMGPPRPPSLRSARLLAAPAGYIFTVATHGVGRMPSYAAELSTTERWAVVAYVKQLQGTPSTSREARDDSLRARAIQRTDSAAAARRGS
jgi:mono/diheme cytochrome c family protein